MKKTIVYFFNLCLIFLFTAAVFAHDEKTADNQKNTKKSSITIDGKELSLEEAIDIVITKNLTLQSAKFDVIMADREILSHDKRYTTTANLEGGYTSQKSPESTLSEFTGSESYQWDIKASVSKLFPSGTAVSAGVGETLYDANDPAIPGFGKTQADPAYHKPSFFVSIQQELLKNAFGYSERLEREIKDNNVTIQRASIIDQLSGLVVKALVDYWAVTVRKSAMDNSTVGLNSAKEVRDIIARNAQYGLAESYDLNQYNALVAGAEATLTDSTRQYNDAVRNFLRTVNMPPETEVKGVTELVDELPALDRDTSVKTAMEKRIDFKNAILKLENAKKEISMEKNNSLPSVSAGARVSTMGQDEDLPPAVKDTATGTYPSLNVNLKMSYPLDDAEQKSKVRNAYFKAKQAEFKLEEKKNEVRDDVLSKLEAVETSHAILINSKIAKTESELYYQKILAKFKLGKTNSIVIRTALDSMVQSRQKELEALVGYNVALLQFDLAKNEIFDRYKVDAEKYIRSIKVEE